MAFNSTFVLRPSYLLAFFLFLLHAGAIAIVNFLDIYPMVALIVIAGVLTSFIIYLRRQALLISRTAIVKLTHKNQDEWLLQDKAGNTLTATLLPGGFRSLHCVILNFCAPATKKRLSIIILPDSLTKTEFRRLRARLLIN